MISISQIKELSKKLNINESVVAREYFQILFLNELYSKSFSNQIFFKGGTCIRIVYGGKRFSEDLDFTVNIDEIVFDTEIKQFFDYLTKTYPISVKAKNSLVGKTFLLTCKIEGFNTDIYIKLDFSFRESVLQPINNIVKTEYPIITSNYFFALSKDEIIAEKVRAIMTRNKLRDLYDLWILQELGGKFDIELVNKKLAYYKESFDKVTFINKIDSFDRKDFIIDLRPFVPVSEREGLGKLFDFVKDYCKRSVEGD